MTIALFLNGKREVFRAMKPVVTVGICVRNCEATVKEAIDSIIDQDFPHELMEVIFVDDGSEDKTLSVILDSVSMMDTEVKVFHSEWKGLGWARNMVVNNAEGEYLIWVDGDMTLPSDHIRKQVEFIDRNPTVGIAKAKHGMRPGEKIVAALENIAYMTVDSEYGGKATSKLPGTGGAIFRVEAVKQVRGFDEHITGVGEDTDVAYRIREAGWSIYMGTQTVFYERRMKTWKGLWDKYFLYGRNIFGVYRRNRNIFSLPKMVPPAALMTGFLYAIGAYKLTRRKVVFLLPFHFVFKMTAWYLGFVRSQTDSLRHTQVL
jgi:glycosyltransferase involved in cell wall biosynthesis